MPMGQAAMKPLNMGGLMGRMPMTRPATTPPPAAAAGMMGGAMGLPSPSAPPEPPFEVKMQADGSSVYLTKTDPQIVIGINPPPKLPKALQPPA